MPKYKMSKDHRRLVGLQAASLQRAVALNGQIAGRAARLEKDLLSEAEQLRKAMAGEESQYRLRRLEAAYLKVMHRLAMVRRSHALAREHGPVDGALSAGAKVSGQAVADAIRKAVCAVLGIPASLLKGRVKGHWRTTESGKMVWVAEYTNKRTKKPGPLSTAVQQQQGGLFDAPAPAPQKPTPQAAGQRSMFDDEPDLRADEGPQEGSREFKALDGYIGSTKHGMSSDLTRDDHTGHLNWHGEQMDAIRKVRKQTPEHHRAFRAKLNEAQRSLEGHVTAHMDHRDKMAAKEQERKNGASLDDANKRRVDSLDATRRAAGISPTDSRWAEAGALLDEAATKLASKDGHDVKDVESESWQSIDWPPYHKAALAQVADKLGLTMPPTAPTEEEAELGREAADDGTAARDKEPEPAADAPQYAIGYHLRDTKGSTYTLEVTGPDRASIVVRDENGRELDRLSPRPTKAAEEDLLKIGSHKYLRKEPGTPADAKAGIFSPGHKVTLPDGRQGTVTDRDTTHMSTLFGGGVTAHHVYTVRLEDGSEVTTGEVHDKDWEPPTPEETEAEEAQRAAEEAEAEKARQERLEAEIAQRPEPEWSSFDAGEHRWDNGNSVYFVSRSAYNGQYTVQSYVRQTGEYDRAFYTKSWRTKSGAQRYLDRFMADYGPRYSTRDWQKIDSRTGRPVTERKAEPAGDGTGTGSAGSTDATGGAVIRDNPDWGSVEVKFPAKPSDEIRARLKNAGFRWSGKHGVWYSKKPGARDAASAILGVRADAGTDEAQGDVAAPREPVWYDPSPKWFRNQQPQPGTTPDEPDGDWRQAEEQYIHEVSLGPNRYKLNNTTLFIQKQPDGLYHIMHYEAGHGRPKTETRGQTQFMKLSDATKRLDELNADDAVKRGWVAVPNKGAGSPAAEASLFGKSARRRHPLLGILGGRP